MRSMRKQEDPGDLTAPTWPERRQEPPAGCKHEHLRWLKNLFCVKLSIPIEIREVFANDKNKEGKI